MKDPEWDEHEIYEERQSFAPSVVRIEDYQNLLEGAPADAKLPDRLFVDVAVAAGWMANTATRGFESLEDGEFDGQHFGSMGLRGLHDAVTAMGALTNSPASL